MIAVIMARELEGPHVRPAESGESSVLIDCSWRLLSVRGVDQDIEGALIRHFQAQGVDAKYFRGGEVAEDDLPEGAVLIWNYSQFPRAWSLAEKQGALDCRVAVRMRTLRDGKSISAALGQLRRLSGILHALPDSGVI